MVRPSLCCHVAWQQNSIKYCWEGSTSTSIQSKASSDIIVQHNEIGTTFNWLRRWSRTHWTVSSFYEALTLVESMSKNVFLIESCKAYIQIFYEDIKDNLILFSPHPNYAYTAFSFYWKRCAHEHTVSVFSHHLLSILSSISGVVSTLRMWKWSPILDRYTSSCFHYNRPWSFVLMKAYLSER